MDKEGRLWKQYPDARWREEVNGPLKGESVRLNTFLLKIVTPSSDFYTGEIDYLCIDTPDGKQGFLRGALPRIGIVSRGTIEITTSVLKMRAFCGDGIYKVDGNGVLLLVDGCAFEGDEAREISVDKTEDGVKNAKVQIAASFKKMRETNADL